MKQKIFIIAGLLCICVSSCQKEDKDKAAINSFLRCISSSELNEKFFHSDFFPQDSFKTEKEREISIPMLLEIKSKFKDIDQVRIVSIDELEPEGIVADLKKRFGKDEIYAVYHIFDAADKAYFLMK